MKAILGAGILAMAVMTGCAQVEKGASISYLPPAATPAKTTLPVDQTASTADATPLNLRQAALDAVSANGEISMVAIRYLRAAGYKGLDALFTTHYPKLRSLMARTSPLALALADADLERILYAIDAVAMQKDALNSKLFWHTSLDNAKREAQATGKPILTLRMLGNLNEELSCANSRFFRTMLYPNAQVNKLLRDRFVLHWESVRPVPVITVDMGDGRRIVRTITGNSIHYILDPQGRLIDGLPGLYGAPAFLNALTKAETAALQTAKLSDGYYRTALREYANQRRQEIDAAWSRDLQNAGLTSGKLADALTDREWQIVAGLHMEDVEFDPNSLALIQSKIAAVGPDGAEAPPIEDAMRRAMSKSRVETPMMRMIVNLSTNAALDTVKNEYQMHTKIYQWLASTNQPLPAFNNRVYAELFQTPATDPWIGLALPDNFSALPNNGLITATVTPSR
jgi:hypothetical protein